MFKRLKTTDAREEPKLPDVLTRLDRNSNADCVARLEERVIAADQRIEDAQGTVDRLRKSRKRALLLGQGDGPTVGRSHGLDHRRSSDLGASESASPSDPGRKRGRPRQQFLLPVFRELLLGRARVSVAAF